MKHVLTYHHQLSYEIIAQRLEQGGKGFLIIVDKDGKFMGVITRNDLRRGLLNRQRDIVDKNDSEPNPFKESENPRNISSDNTNSNTKYLSIVNEENRFIDLLQLSDRQATRRPNKVIIMAGGMGKRLGELTASVPKPMLPMGHKPLLHLIFDSFLDHGFQDFYFCVNYKSQVIKEYFGDGTAFGGNITYIEESKPLGTAGPLSLIDVDFDEPVFVMNGDLVTTLNFEHLLDFHLEREAVGTMCIHEFNQQLPYGVVNTRNSQIISLEEKPYHKCFINAGIYMLNPEVLSMVPHNEYYDITTLFEEMLQQDIPTHAYTINEFWVDIGQAEDYERTQKVFNDLYS